MLDALHVEAVVHILLPFEGRGVEKFVTHGCSIQELLVLHIVVRQSGQLASLPGVVSDED